MNLSQKKVIASIVGDTELKRVTEKSDIATIRGVFQFALDFEKVMSKTGRNSEKELQYHASTIRSRMDTYFDFKYLCNFLVPASKKLQVAFPASDRGLSVLHSKLLKEIMRPTCGNEVRLLNLKRILALELYFFARHY